MFITERLVWCFAERTVDEFTAAMGAISQVGLMCVCCFRRFYCWVHLSLLRNFSVATEQGVCETCPSKKRHVLTRTIRLWSCSSMSHCQRELLICVFWFASHRWWGISCCDYWVLVNLCGGYWEFVLLSLTSKRSDSHVNSSLVVASLLFLLSHCWGVTELAV